MIFAKDLDEETLKQFEECKKQPFVVKAALMPDAHLGYVAPIGSVLVTKDFVVPSWVGYDIGCGMTSAKINLSVQEIKENSNNIFKKVKEFIPMGKGNLNKDENITKETQEEYEELVQKYTEKEYSKEILNFLKNGAMRHLGSLGDGNHFIELGCFEGEVWITVHSGSRGVGYKVAERYMKKSANKEEDFEQTFPLEVSSQLGKEYLNVLNFGLEFALLNRKEMIKKVVKALEMVLKKQIEYEIWVNKNHNHAVLENKLYVHRKGATPAKKQERGVIPATMKDGCFLVEGLGSEKFLNSSSHGAGRVISRLGAKENFTMDQFKEQMKGITGTVTEGTLDESPMAYKNIYEVMEAQKESVKVLKQIKPLINWKGERRGKKGKC